MRETKDELNGNLETAQSTSQHSQSRGVEVKQVRHLAV